MEVTKSNFEEVYPMVCRSIDEATFLSIDTEFTGLGRKGDNKHNGLDTQEERYIKMKNDVRQYNMIQFGLSTFKINLTNKSVQTATYSFYLNGNEDAAYKYDSSSLEFLASHGFNFNKLFNDGIHVMSLLDEEKLNKKEENVYIRRPQKIKSLESNKFVSKITAELKAINEFSSNKTLVIPVKDVSSFHRKVIFDNIALAFPTYVFHHSRVTSSFKITRFESIKDKEDYLHKRSEDSLRKKVGFGLIGRKIMQADKPIIGHNCILDILHFMDKIVAPLPDSYEEFKTLVRSNMPVIFDTKLFAKDPPFSAKILHSALIFVYEEMSVTLTDISITTVLGTKSYSIGDSVENEHDAGCDAFITGICFLGMMKKLQGSLWMKKDPFQLQILKNYANRVNVMSSTDIPYMDLVKKDVVPDRSNVFVVECPPTWNESDIKNCFKVLRFYKTCWVNDSKVFVIPQDPKSVALEKVICNCPPNVYISMYKLPSQKNCSPVETQRPKHQLDDEVFSDSVKKEIKRVKNEDLSNISRMSLDSPGAGNVGKTGF